MVGRRAAFWALLLRLGAECLQTPQLLLRRRAGVSRVRSSAARLDEDAPLESRLAALVATELEIGVPSSGSGVKRRSRMHRLAAELAMLESYPDSERLASVGAKVGALIERRDAYKGPIGELVDALGAKVAQLNAAPPPAATAADSAAAAAGVLAVKKTATPSVVAAEKKKATKPRRKRPSAANRTVSGSAANQTSAAPAPKKKKAAAPVATAATKPKKKTSASAEPAPAANASATQQKKKKQAQKKKAPSPPSPKAPKAPAANASASATKPPPAPKKAGGASKAPKSSQLRTAAPGAPPRAKVVPASPAPVEARPARRAMAAATPIRRAMAVADSKASPPGPAVRRAPVALGDVVVGTCVALRPFGAMIALDAWTAPSSHLVPGASPRTALLHLSEISAWKVEDLGAVLPVGARVTCLVASIDEAKRRTTVSTRVLEARKGDMLTNSSSVYATAEQVAAGVDCDALERANAKRKKSATKITKLERLSAKFSLEDLDALCAPKPKRAAVVVENAPPAAQNANTLPKAAKSASSASAVSPAANVAVEEAPPAPVARRDALSLNSAFMPKQQTEQQQEQRKQEFELLMNDVIYEPTSSLTDVSKLIRGRKKRGAFTSPFWTKIFPKQTK